jgi:hypothetical protein
MVSRSTIVESSWQIIADQNISYLTILDWSCSCSAGPPPPIYSAFTITPWEGKEGNEEGDIFVGFGYHRFRAIPKLESWFSGWLES